MCVLFFFTPDICKNAPAASALSAPHPKGWGVFSQVFQNFNVIIRSAAYTARINRKGVTLMKYRHEWKHEITALMCCAYAGVFRR